MWVRAPRRAGTCVRQREEGKTRRWVLAHVSEEEVVWLSAERRKKMIPRVCKCVARPALQKKPKGMLCLGS